MATFMRTGISPVVPAVDVRAHPEGADAATAAERVQAFFPDQRLKQVDHGRFGQVGAWSETQLLVGVFGGTTVLSGVHPDALVIPEGMGTYFFALQTTSDAWAVEVYAPPLFERHIELCADEIVTATGEELPFERRFWSGEEDTLDDPDVPVRFEVSEWGSAAMEWMFGYDAGSDGPTADGFDPESTWWYVFEFVKQSRGDALARRLGLR